MKVLVVDDDRKTIAYLRNRLSESGFVVDVAENGADGLHLASTGDHDVIVLDVMLPQRDGWSVLTALRSSGKQTPVLFLTACDSASDRVKGLELGADDYLVKPFAFSELRGAPARAVAPRTAPASRNTLRCGSQDGSRTAKVTRGGRPIELTAKEFQMLSFLVRRAGEILPDILIAKQVWDMNFDSDADVVGVAIRRLRSKVDEPFDTSLIHSARGMGYVLEIR